VSFHAVPRLRALVACGSLVHLPSLLGIESSLSKETSGSVGG
jgi:hypothetical protein